MKNLDPSGELALLAPVLSKWREMIATYSQKVEGVGGSRDAAFWYTERANVGVLAAAIWQEDGIALEEFNDDKDWEHGPYRGRVDLWFQLGNTPFVVEAKLCWIRQDHYAESEWIAADVDRSLELATKDAVRSMPTEKATRLGVSFVVPYSRKGGAIGDWLRVFSEGCGSVDDQSFRVWAEVAGCHDNGREYPGVMLIGREVTGQPTRRTTA